MNVTHHVSWKEAQKTADELWHTIQENHAERGTFGLNNIRVYGVPKNGWMVALLLQQRNSAPGAQILLASTPEEADIIVDDLIDSGETEKRYKLLGKPFYTMFDKQPGVWLHLPWEKGSVADGEENVRRLLQWLGEDINREGLRDTPRRVVAMYQELTTPRDFKYTTFDANGYDQMIIERDIPFYSLCEHHMVPFFGVAHVGYVPDKRLVGLSKLCRLVELHARGLRTQEYMTQAIANDLQEGLKPRGVGVAIVARHLCQEMRGVKKHNVSTTTSVLYGFFKEDEKCRAEFMNLIT